MKHEKKVLVLMGIKHCGKSTQGKLLAEHFACPLYDTDTVIQKSTGKSPRELYTQSGEAAFIKAEAQACSSIIAKLAPTAAPYTAVIATGGGICNNPDALAALRASGIFVFLNADEKTAADRIVREVRVNADGTLSNMPAYIAKEQPQSLEAVRDAFHRFYVARSATYQSLADVTVAMQAVPPDVNMRLILASLAESA